MAYNLIITERADELIDERVAYLIKRKKNPAAAKHLLDGLDKIYDRLEENPFQFPDSKDSFLRCRGYKEALIADMDYKVVFRFDDDAVHIVGFFHDLEDYSSKIFDE